jgi:hypothetical protein
MKTFCQQVVFFSSWRAKDTTPLGSSQGQNSCDSTPTWTDKQQEVERTFHSQKASPLMQERHSAVSEKAKADNRSPILSQGH